ncbi:MAG: hypothetical protein AB1629_02700 [Candidatus Omnitrophota bacterium]
MKLIRQDNLLKIAKTWHIKRTPKYRAFKCANCRRFLHRAWHHWLHSGGFRTPIHLCQKCHNNLDITYPALNLYPVRELHKKHRNFSNGVKLKKIKFSFKKEVRKFLIKIISGWDIAESPLYKQFTCDYCKRIIYKTYHIFFKANSKISEVHLCKYCNRLILLKSNIKN